MRLELANMLCREEISWRHKVIEKWLQEGDRNTRYFHNLAAVEVNVIMWMNCWLRTLLFRAMIE